jgi:thymidylate synthase
MKVTINQPLVFDTFLTDPLYGASVNRINRYLRNILSGDAPEEGTSYTYGNRIRAYFGVDQLQKVIDDISSGGDSRHAYVSLWDGVTDGLDKSSPCLVSLFVRNTNNRINLTACFRTHNGGRAWPINAIGLSLLLNHLVDEVNDRAESVNHKVEAGMLTIISHSISLNPEDQPNVELLIETRNKQSVKVVLDPAGYFKITTDGPVVVAQHYSPDGVLLNTYRDENTERMLKAINTDACITTIQHALYVASQIERAGWCIKTNSVYTQDKRPQPV